MAPKFLRQYLIPSSYIQILNLTLTLSSITYTFPVVSVNYKVSSFSKNLVHTFLYYAFICCDIFRTCIYFQWFYLNAINPNLRDSPIPSYMPMMLLYPLITVNLIAFFKVIFGLRQIETKSLLRGVLAMEKLLVKDR